MRDKESSAVGLMSTDFVDISLPRLFAILSSSVSKAKQWSEGGRELARVACPHDTTSCLRIVLTMRSGNPCSPDGRPSQTARRGRTLTSWRLRGATSTSPTTSASDGGVNKQKGVSPSTIGKKSYRHRAYYIITMR